MKKLKKLLILSIFSLLFIVNVKAVTYKNIFYSNNTINVINNYSSLFDNIATYITNNAQSLNTNVNIDFVNDKNILVYDTEQNFSNGKINVFVLSKNHNVEFGNNRTYYLEFAESTCQISFNTSNFYINNITCSSGISSHSKNLYSYFNTGITYFFDWRLGANNEKYFANNSPYYLNINNETLIVDANSQVSLNQFTNSLNNNLMPSREPQYTINQTILDNGNVKLDFTFTNYTSDETYGFTITNRVSGQEYGIANPYTSIYPNIIPYGETYSIEIPYDTIINVSLSLYTQIEETNLYDREVLYVDSYDINNIVFNNPQNPHFSIISQTQNNLIGRYNNTKTGDICGHIYNNNNIEWETNCNEVLDIDFSLNGYVEVYVKRNNNIIYSRKINYIANQQTLPYITWETTKQDFYSVINWSIKNYNNTMTYRYSKDNGNTFTPWANATENSYINVYDNNTIIIEIANSDQSTIYDSKAINIVNSISNLGEKSNATNNFINKFTSIFSVNGNILNNINQYWEIIKSSKLYLLIFIPFITSIICGIIYLIRRK